MSSITLKLQAGLTEDEEQSVITQIERMDGVACLNWVFPKHKDAELRLIYVANLNDLAKSDNLVAAFNTMAGVENAYISAKRRPMIQAPSPR